ncbi:hypothetical protein MLD38_016764 [Melastoma candidum]|uniref:Uncharacterized protein n=1 Tax=Melastoma candidum TaxID=119954 RepID=A0ACB9QPS1_9MYRT|nr:hypothetical protein MLD38_016764 [Melastoma candidum]
MPMHVDSPAGAPPPRPRRPNADFPGISLRAWPPAATPPQARGRQPRQSHNYDSSANALSFGFLATAILVSMFLVVAVFERFLRPADPPGVEPREVESGKPRCFPSPKMKVYDSGVSVLMPGDEVPSFIARPAPIQPPHEHRHPQPTQHPISNSTSTPSHSRMTQDGNQ